MADKSLVKSQETFSSDVALVWEDKDKIRKIFAPQLTDSEFDFFMTLGMSLGANPFKREIWAVKFGQNPANIFLGRDFDRRAAQELAEYGGHTVDAVYKNDSFKKIDDGKTIRIDHQYNLQDRGALLGAYSLTYRRNIERPFYIFVPLAEYNTGLSSWKGKPSTMIKKVAEAQGLRMAFQGTFGGTYSEAEESSMDKNAPGEAEIEASDLTEKIQKRADSIEDVESEDVNVNPELEEPEEPEQVVDINTDEPVTGEEVNKLRKLMEEAGIKSTGVGKILALYNVPALTANNMDRMQYKSLVHYVEAQKKSKEAQQKEAQQTAAL